MLPLRFSNSGIRAKVFMSKIGFKLHVIRSNRVESFYTFLLCFCSKRSEERGQPAMAKPSAGVAGHGQAPYRGSRPRLATCKGRRAMAKAPCTRGCRLWLAHRGGSRLRLAHKGGSRPQARSLAARCP
ncbi:hypothetical protein B296_00021074 [Ensete ventricosum]|uniref:Uncharacterized protein n=1 Tax=Ensete ventricosum TaxID=4639 RepID=A0A426Z6E3_ENSVE|nr:hypothetical protein B296_00021074 [Ensete ventricosum]